MKTTLQERQQQALAQALVALDQALREAVPYWLTLRPSLAIRKVEQMTRLASVRYRFDSAVARPRAVPRAAPERST